MENITFHRVVILIVLFAIFLGCKKKEEAPAPAPAVEAPKPVQAPMSASAAPAAPVTKSGGDEKYSTKLIDSIVAMLEQASFAYKIPETIDYAESARVELRISKKLSEGEIKKDISLKKSETIESGQTKISNKIQATLTSTDFSITSKTPDTQLISSVDTFIWQWDIKPLHQGLGGLHLSVNALLDEGPYVLRSLDREIKVTITSASRARLFIDKNWEYLKWGWTAIFIPIFGYLWKKRKTKPENGNDNNP